MNDRLHQQYMEAMRAGDSIEAAEVSERIARHAERQGYAPFAALVRMGSEPTLETTLTQEEEGEIRVWWEDHSHLYW